MWATQKPAHPHTKNTRAKLFVPAPYTPINKPNIKTEFIPRLRWGDIREMPTHTRMAALRITKQNFPHSTAFMHHQVLSKHASHAFVMYKPEYTQNDVVAVAFLVPIEDIPMVYYLQSFAVEKEYQRMGIGSAMLASMQQLGLITVLHVDKTPDDQNKHAHQLVAFYEKNGYERIMHHTIRVPNDPEVEYCMVSPNMPDEIKMQL